MNNKIPRSILFFIMTILFFISGYSQDHQKEEHHHDKNETSIALGVVPLPEEDKVTAGLHFHYVRGVTHNNRLGIGAALETIIDEHKHFTISGVIQYRIIKGFILGYGPGILLLIEEEKETEYHFAQHFEAVYEFDLGHFHLGPLFEVGWANNHVHYMIGLHFGIDF